MKQQAATAQDQQQTVISGQYFEKGEGFNALSFREKAFEGRMDPLVMVDHYRMTAPTFGAHAHAGLSAVSVLFEDSSGHFRNRDSMGNDIDLLPGDLFWLSTGSGAVHDEYPRSGSGTHGLQVFVNTPKANKHDAPQALHVQAKDMPVIEQDGYRVRVVLGATNGIQGQQSPVLPMTILDGFLQAEKTFSHQPSPEHNSWIIAIDGELQIITGEESVLLAKGKAFAITANNAAEQASIHICNAGATEQGEQGHFVIFSGEAINEEFVQDGPFVMSNQQEIDQVRADYAAGKLGAIPDSDDV